MDGQEHDVTPSPQEIPHHQDPLRAAEHHARETEIHPLVSRFERAQAGDEKEQAFLLTALHCQSAEVLLFLKEQADCGNTAACQLLRGYYLSVLLGIRGGNKRAGVILRRHVLDQDWVVCTFLTELIDRGDQVAQKILYGGWLKLCWRGDTRLLAFFRQQLQNQQGKMLAFLSERALYDNRIRTLFLFPYYQSLLPRAAARNEQEIGIFQDQLQCNDKTVQAFLVQQVEQESDSAFRVVWEYYQPEIHHYILRMVRNAMKADDLTTNVFLKASHSLRRRQGKEREMNLRPWLYKVARNVTIDSLRRKQVATLTSSIGVDLDNVGGLQPGPEDEVCDREISKPLLEALQQLGDQERQCILMHDVYGYSTQEIATKLGVKQGTVTSNLSRGRKNLRSYYHQACDRQQDAEGQHLFKRLFSGGSTLKEHKEKKGRRKK